MAESKWPTEPYKGLGYYDIGDALLFAGRDTDVNECVHMLAEPKMRTLLLHGRTGCGKSSFLRAGVIPALEDRGFGFTFLRGSDGLPVIIRSTADPIARISEELFRFTERPQRIATARGP